MQNRLNDRQNRRDSASRRDREVVAARSGANGTGIFRRVASRPVSLRVSVVRWQTENTPPWTFLDGYPQWVFKRSRTDGIAAPDVLLRRSGSWRRVLPPG